MASSSCGVPWSQIETATESDIQAGQRATKACMKRVESGKMRLVDPTGCEIDYTEDEVEFATAMQNYKTQNGRPFPTWHEVLSVVRSLGYQKMGRMV